MISFFMIHLLGDLYFFGIGIDNWPFVFNNFWVLFNVVESLVMFDFNDFYFGFNDFYFYF